MSPSHAARHSLVTRLTISPPLPIGNHLAAALMSDIYEDHKDEDGFLYITYSGENTFG